MKKLGLSTRVFIGFGLGILLGVIFGEKILVIKIIGDIFLKLIKMLTVPLVFFSIISGITNLTDVNKLKRVGAKILGMYVVTTLLAGFIGLGIAHLINPGVGFQIDSSAIGSYEATAMNSVSDTLLAMVPDNIINAMANTNMMTSTPFSRRTSAKRSCSSWATFKYGMSSNSRRSSVAGVSDSSSSPGRCSSTLLSFPISEKL